MAQNDAATDTTEVPPPGFVLPGVRCALEMVIVGFAVLWVGLPAANPFYTGFVYVVALSAMMVVFFWALNQQMETWIARARRGVAATER